MDHEVRRVRAEEWREYRELRLEALKDSPLAFVQQYDDAVAQPDEFWRDRVAGNAAGATSCTFVAVRGGRFVGQATGVIEADVTDQVWVHVVGVYVTPALRGTGVADALVTAVVRWAREEVRADRVRLFVAETNDRAAAFYRRLGFVATGATMVYPPDPTLTELEMEYRGAPAVGG